MLTRLINLILFLTFLVFFLPSTTYADFKKYEFNPVIKPGSAGEWNDKGTWAPSVIYDNNEYKMWYVGSNNTTSQIGYATSSDGINWSVHKEPVLSPINPERGLGEMSVIKDGQMYKMWFTVLNSDYSLNIHYATSENGISWERYSTAVLNPDLWETNRSVASPSVIKIGNDYHMWYIGNDGTWKIGYAFSTDGINWKKNNTPVLTASESWENSDPGKPSVVYHKNKFIMAYHVNFPIRVIGLANSIDRLSWNKNIDISNPIITSGSQIFDSRNVSGPSLLILNNIYHIWYSGEDDSGILSIGYATTGEFPSNLTPIILIPGMFASWNSQALLEGADPPREQWITTPFVNHYQGIIETLKKAGYIDDPNSPRQNLFMFNYDWRDRVEDTASLLNEFIENVVKTKNPDKSPYIVGHSLGGLIGRAYLQKYGKEKINTLITLGTPHSGAVQAYKAWEGGEIENDDPLQKLAFEILLGVNRNGFRTDKDVIREIAPVVHDLLPTFDFLKDNNNQIISTSSLTHKNTWLGNLENDFSKYFANFEAIYGETNLTPEWYKVQQPNLIENILGLWQDGKPTETLTTIFGDEVVLSKSATRSADPATLIKNVNHGDLVVSYEGIDKLMKLLNINTQEIITPQRKSLLPSLFFAIRSPAKFNVSGPVGFFESDENGLVFIPQPVNGQYDINVTGNASGRYHLLIGQLSDKESVWKEITNSTNENKVDEYKIIYNSSSPLNQLLVDQDGSLYLNNAYQAVEELKEKYPHWSLSLSSLAIKNAQDQLKNKKNKDAAFSIKKAIINLFTFRKKQTLAEPLNISFLIVNDLITAYEKITTLERIKINKIKLQAEIIAVAAVKEASFIKLKAAGKETSAASYNLGEKLFTEAQNDFNNNNLTRAEIELMIAKLLFSEV